MGGRCTRFGVGLWGPYEGCGGVRRCGVPIGDTVIGVWGSWGGAYEVWGRGGGVMGFLWEVCRGQDVRDSYRGCRNRGLGFLGVALRMGLGLEMGLEC